MGGRLGFAVLDGCQDPSDPAGDGRVAIYVSRDDLLARYRRVRSGGFDLLTAYELLQRPDRIYQGTEEDPSGWVYAGVPASRVAKPGISLPMPPGFVFCATVNVRRILLLWRLEKTTLAGLDACTGPGLRFTRIAWRKP